MSRRADSINILRYLSFRCADDSERYPDYWRWDVRVDYRTHFEKFNIVAYIDVQNVTNREKVWGYNWDKVRNEHTTIRQTGFFPIGGLKIEF